MSVTKFRYTIRSGTTILAMLTLHGDKDADCQAALNLMINESLAVARAMTGTYEVEIHWEGVELEVKL